MEEGVTNTSSTDTPDVDAKKDIVPVENRIAELNRKFSGLNGKIDQIISSLQTKGASEVVDETPKRATQAKGSYNAVDQLRDEMLTEKHVDSFKRAVESFPELDSKSENFDEGFYQETDALFRQLSMTRDPDAPLKAAKFVALEKGKFAQLERNKVLADESRRSRVLSEGGTGPRQASKPKEFVPENLQTLAGLLGADQAKLKDHLKANAKRYRLGE
jgi:hypothetical protein